MYHIVTRQPNSARTAPMVAKFVAGPANKKTIAAPVGMPAATNPAAIGTEAVAQTYRGNETINAPAKEAIRPQPELATGHASAGTQPTKAAEAAMPNNNQSHIPAKTSSATKRSDRDQV